MRNGLGVQDHPRVSGEHVVGAGYRLSVPGSSPRERGALVPCVTSTRTMRIIPA